MRATAIKTMLHKPSKRFVVTSWLILLSSLTAHETDLWHPTGTDSSIEYPLGNRRWLTSRGLKTLSITTEAQRETAIKVLMLWPSKGFIVNSGLILFSSFLT